MPGEGRDVLLRDCPSGLPEKAFPHPPERRGTPARPLLRRLAVGTIGLLAAAATIAAVAPAASARPATSSRVILTAPLTPSVPSDAPIYGVQAGAVPWVLHAGHVVLGEHGRLQVNASGFVVPGPGTNPLPALSASVYCDGTLAGTTGTVPFPPSGNARIHTTVTLPGACTDPVVLVNPGPHVNLYIASTPTS